MFKFKEIQSEQNVINDLHEFCFENYLPEPQYKVVQSTGSAHKPEFTYECRVDHVIRLANAGTKKGAKHLSALKMFKAFQEVCLFFFKIPILIFQKMYFFL